MVFQCPTQPLIPATGCPPQSRDHDGRIEFAQTAAKVQQIPSHYPGNPGYSVSGRLFLTSRQGRLSYHSIVRSLVNRRQGIRSRNTGGDYDPPAHCPQLFYDSWRNSRWVRASTSTCTGTLTRQTDLLTTTIVIHDYELKFPLPIDEFPFPLLIPLTTVRCRIAMWGCTHMWIVQGNHVCT